MSLLSPSLPLLSSSEAAPIVVIDTNVLLDWLVFEDAAAFALGQAVESGALRWIGTQAMREELAHVLSRATFERWSTRHAGALAVAELRCEMQAEPTVAAEGRLHCSDPDDQKFIDLAMTHPARWLITRDKALLRLARKARPRGVDVLTPPAWAKQVASPSIAPTPE